VLDLCASRRRACTRYGWGRHDRDVRAVRVPLVFMAPVVLPVLPVLMALVVPRGGAVPGMGGRARTGPSRALTLIAGPHSRCACEERSHRQSEKNPEPSHWYSSFVVAVRCLAAPFPYVVGYDALMAQPITRARPSPKACLFGMSPARRPASHRSLSIAVARRRRRRRFNGASIPARMSPYTPDFLNFGVGSAGQPSTRRGESS
jgi:hypothetical protein